MYFSVYSEAADTPSTHNNELVASNWEQLRNLVSDQVFAIVSNFVPGDVLDITYQAEGLHIRVERHA